MLSDGTLSSTDAVKMYSTCLSRNAKERCAMRLTPPGLRDLTDGREKRITVARSWLVATWPPRCQAVAPASSAYGVRTGLTSPLMRARTISSSSDHDFHPSISSAFDGFNAISPISAGRNNALS